MVTREGLRPTEENMAALKKAATPTAQLPGSTEVLHGIPTRYFDAAGTIECVDPIVCRVVMGRNV